MGRRIEKKVSDWNASTWVLSLDRKFVYDGWLLLLELDGANGDAVVKKYTWGLDLSRTLQGAGGIGGLLATHVVSGATDYLYHYDNLGNVGQMTDLSGTFVAQYEYNAYGGVQSQDETYDGENPFRFSTKYFDDETELGYWGYRYYSPSLGRWLNRDPIGEYDDADLYVFVGNAPLVYADPLGLCRFHRFRITAKSFIARIGSNTGWASRDYKGAFLQALTDRNFSEDPLVNPWLDWPDKHYRLYSSLTVTLACCGSTLRLLEADFLTDVGNDGPLEGVRFPASVTFPPVWQNASLDDLLSGTYNPTVSRSCIGFSWMLEGAPNPAAELVVWGLGRGIVRPNRIWHKVEGTICCSNGQASVSASLRGSRFPSHRLWIDGDLTEELDQGPMSNLWESDPNDSDRVR